ncbi:uncharacterized protein ASCRUDRAFT_155923 [Ascoidea rubescens DSM 1968]|uniref:Uncharacterized protein n=1 Tax=Ascoidea rubescens DSM 1968 TaxID=1344418 RepID=A0A1D2VF20_9ASCO|nr:hypothetical protein ASCRUDRAFT_155923 [Ascoidea rubescens DSM 1968]ODV60067.1 hypothetical protein ASCRUDRAFT_155923 [Ascoidea rubescens DSM 1968]
MCRSFQWLCCRKNCETEPVSPFGGTKSEDCFNGETTKFIVSRFKSRIRLLLVICMPIGMSLLQLLPFVGFLILSSLMNTGQVVARTIAARSSAAARLE